MTVWKQELNGVYTAEGHQTIEVRWDYPSVGFYATDDLEMHEYFGSVEDVNTFLINRGMPPLNITPRSKATDWTVYQNHKEFDNNDWCKRVWYKSTDNGETKVLSLYLFSDRGYKLQLWDTGYQWPMHFETNMLGFIEEYKRNPETDFDVAVSQAMGHGASGMEKNWYDMKTIDDVKVVLTEIGVKDGVDELK